MLQHHQYNEIHRKYITVYMYINLTIIINIDATYYSKKN